MTGRTIVICGSPTALGGHFGGMERTPTLLRGLGLRDRLAARPGLAGTTWLDHGDAANDPGWVADPDPRAKNIDRLVGYLGRLAAHVETGLQQADGDAAELLVLGGDCTTHAGAMAGIRRARPGIRLGLAWFDANGMPQTLPDGVVSGVLKSPCASNHASPSRIPGRARRMPAIAPAWVVQSPPSTSSSPASPSAC